MSEHFRYFVEGPCEKALLKAFMFCDGDSFHEGQVEVFNFINEKMSNAYARTIQRNTKVVIVIDTDVERIDILEENIQTLQKISLIDKKDIFIVLSIMNFEEEIVFSCDEISNIHQLFSTKGTGEYKKKFIAHKNLNKKLLSSGFDIKKIWNRESHNIFSKYQNDGDKIKRK